MYEWLADYYDGDHLTRAGDWLLALAPEAPEYLVLAALTHDLERSVPGGPTLDKARTSWDDRAYNTAHCERSAEIVSSWLAQRGAPGGWVTAVRQPIVEHEFGGSPEGDLMQAADSISFLETNGDLVAGWIRDGECTPEKGRAKLRWMCDRVRLDRGVGPAVAYFERVMVQLDRGFGT